MDNEDISVWARIKMKPLSHRVLTRKGDAHTSKTRADSGFLHLELVASDAIDSDLLGSDAPDT